MDALPTGFSSYPAITVTVNVPGRRTQTRGKMKYLRLGQGLWDDALRGFEFARPSLY